MFSVEIVEPFHTLTMDATTALAIYRAEKDKALRERRVSHVQLMAEAQDAFRKMLADAQLARKGGRPKGSTNANSAAAASAAAASAAAKPTTKPVKEVIVALPVAVKVDAAPAGAPKGTAKTAVKAGSSSSKGRPAVKVAPSIGHTIPSSRVN